jgi:hypothetical protein
MIAFVDHPSDEELTGLSRVVAYDWAERDEKPMYVAYALRFREAVLLIEADPNTDSVVLSIASSPELTIRRDELPRPVDLTEDAGWAECLEAIAGWRWLLTNQNGYTDGFQLELIRSGESVVVQWMVWGSELYCVRVPPTP